METIWNSGPSTGRRLAPAEASPGLFSTWGEGRFEGRELASSLRCATPILGSSGNVLDRSMRHVQATDTREESESATRTPRWSVTRWLLAGLAFAVGALVLLAELVVLFLSALNMSAYCHGVFGAEPQCSATMTVFVDYLGLILVVATPLIVVAGLWLRRRWLVAVGFAFPLVFAAVGFAAAALVPEPV